KAQIIKSKPNFLTYTLCGIVSNVLVNGFQNCILAYNYQLTIDQYGRTVGCELLSKLYFSL
uniref:hypothetical protein n=1 Tax=Flavobacterium psychrophilum TaxID=96345 RepID=UPI001E2F3A26